MKEHKQHPRTEQQNRALHKYCELVAQSLNEAGLTIEEVLKHFTMELDWTKESVKEILWRTAQKRMFGKQSTTELLKGSGEINQIHEAMTRFLAKLGVEYIPFPNDELENETRH